MNRADILDTAKQYVTQDRAAAHGSVEDNFAKIAALCEAGTEVANRQPLFGPLTAHNRRYLSAMADRQGHLLHALLDEQEEAGPASAPDAARGWTA